MTDEDVKSAVVETQTLCRENAKQIEGLTLSVGKLVDRMEAKGGINWAALTVFAAIFVPAIAGAWVLMNTQIGALKEVVQSADVRLQRMENVTDKDRESKAKMWDNFVFQKMTQAP